MHGSFTIAITAQWFLCPTLRSWKIVYLIFRIANNLVEKRGELTLLDYVPKKTLR